MTASLTTSLRDAVALTERPARPSPVSTTLTFGWRALLKIKHVPEQLFDVLVSPVIFTLMFTYLFGGALAGSTQAYIQFLLPGILVQTILFVTIYTGYTLNNDISKGVFDRFRSLPIWRPSPVVGALLGDTVRYTVAAVITITLGLILGFRPDGGAGGVLLGVLLLLVFAFALSWTFIILGLLVRSPNAVMGISMIVLMPLTFASNVFVDPDTMPSGLRAFVNVNPVSHLVTAVRGLMAGSPDVTEIVWVLIASVALTAVLGPIAMRIYRRKS